MLNLDRLNRDEVGMTDHPSRGRETTTLPEMRRAGIAVCQATLLARAKPEIRQPEGHARISLDFANQEIASATVRGQLAYYELLGAERLSADDPDQFRSRHPLGCFMTGNQNEPIGYPAAMEGADPIVEPSQAVEWWNLGLRSVNLADYGKSRYAVGNGDDGPLTRGRSATAQGIRATGHDPRRDPSVRHKLLSGTAYLSWPGAGQPQQLPGLGYLTVVSSATSRFAC